MNSVGVENISVEIADFVGPFDAVSLGDSWNGWECPLFSFEVACDAIAACIAEGQVGGYDEESDRFWIVLGEPVDGLEGLNRLTDRTAFDWEEWKDADGQPMPSDPDEVAPGVHLDWYGASDLEGRKVYGIGAYGWCWEAVS